MEEENRGHPRLNFGDDQSSLMDEFERLSLEIEFKKAELASVSIPCIPTTKIQPLIQPTHKETSAKHCGFWQILKKVWRLKL